MRLRAKAASRRLKRALGGHFAPLEPIENAAARFRAVSTPLLEKVRGALLGAAVAEVA
jgi:hypothetical protein